MPDDPKRKAASKAVKIAQKQFERDRKAARQARRSAERKAGLFVVFAIFVSACVAGIEAVSRLINPHAPTHLPALALAGLIGFGGNRIAAIIRTRAGRSLDSPALIADGNHARADSYVSLAVVASTVVVALGLPIADPPDRPGDSRGDPQDHLGLVVDPARPPPLGPGRAAPSSSQELLPN